MIGFKTYVILPGINIVVIGIGPGVNKAELIKIAGDPKNVYTTTDFAHLIGPAFIGKIKANACKKANAGKLIFLVEG